MIHVVISDTNQTSLDYTAKVLNEEFKTNTYMNPRQDGSFEKVDNYRVQGKGTNSKGTKMFDVAIYRSDLVKLKQPVIYFSQSSGAVTATDHCDLAIEVELTKNFTRSGPAKRRRLF